MPAGRPKKLTLDFFLHDAKASDDLKIQKLERRHKCEGYATFFKLLELLCQNDGMKLDLNDPEDIDLLAQKFHLRDAAHLTTIIQYCAQIGLFDKQLWEGDRTIFSQTLYQRYLNRLEDRKAAAARKQRAADVNKLEKRITEAAEKERIITVDNSEKLRDNHMEIPIRRNTHATRSEDPELSELTEDPELCENGFCEKPESEPISHGQALDVEILDSEPCEPFVVPFPTTAIVSQDVLVEPQRIGGDQYSAAPLDKNLLSLSSVDVLRADAPEGYVHPAAAFEARMNPNAFPWKRCPNEVMEAFKEYFANVNRRKGETPQQALYVAARMIQQANSPSAIGTDKYQRVHLAWTQFMENAQKSSTVAEATGQSPQLPSGWGEFLQKRRSVS